MILFLLSMKLALNAAKGVRAGDELGTLFRCYFTLEIICPSIVQAANRKPQKKGVALITKIMCIYKAFASTGDYEGIRLRIRRQGPLPC